MRAQPVKETKGKKGIVLVLQKHLEKTRIREIKRRVLAKKGLFPTGLRSDNLTYFSGNISKVLVFLGQLVIQCIYFGIFASKVSSFEGHSSEIPNLTIWVLASTGRDLGEESD